LRGHRRVASSRPIHRFTASQGTEGRGSGSRRSRGTKVMLLRELENGREVARPSARFVRGHGQKKPEKLLLKENTMENSEALKELVREKYGQIAREGGCCGGTSCCGPAAEGNVILNISEDYSRLEGHVEDADLGLGCGIPTDAADLKAGHVVLDLGSGAGNDAFVARRLVGEKGKVIGVDMTPDMIRKARENVAKLGFGNVEFRLGEIEALPVETSGIDRVISNCVLNLVPDKKGA